MREGDDKGGDGFSEKEQDLLSAVLATPEMRNTRISKSRWIFQNRAVIAALRAQGHPWHRIAMALTRVASGDAGPSEETTFSEAQVRKCAGLNAKKKKKQQQKEKDERQPSPEGPPRATVARAQGHEHPAQEPDAEVTRDGAKRRAAKQMPALDMEDL